MFSVVKNIKTKCRSSLHTSTPCDLLEVNIEGPSLGEFSADAAVDLWWTECCTTRRVNQKPRKEYTPQATRGDGQSEMIVEFESAESTQSLVLDD